MGRHFVILINNFEIERMLNEMLLLQTSEACNSNPPSASSFSPDHDVIIPKNWGSILEGESDFGKALGDSSRFISLSMIQEPFLISLCRKNGIAFIREESIDYLRQLIQKMLTLFISAVPEVTGGDPSAVLNDTVAAAVCEHFGLPIVGAATLSYYKEEDDMEFIQNALKTGVDAAQGNVWGLFIAEVTASFRQNRELASSLALMRRLVETDRASVRDPTVASTAAFICYKLDDNTFRYMMSFLLTKDQDSSKMDRNISTELFDDDISDNWNTDLFPTLGEHSSWVWLTARMDLQLLNDFVKCLSMDPMHMES